MAKLFFKVSHPREGTLSTCFGTLRPSSLLNFKNSHTLWIFFLVTTFNSKNSFERVI